MASLNQCNFIGNLGRDPEIRTMANGNKVCNISLACNESWKDKQSGERKEKTNWIRIVIFDERLVDVAEKYLRKGSKAFFQGAMQTRKWTDQSGVEKYSTEVVLQKFRGQLQLLDKRDGANTGGGEASPVPAGGDFDDEIPF